MPHPAWTPEMITQLRELYAKGLTNPEIGIAMGKSPSAISKRLGLHGMARFTQHRGPVAVDGYTELAPTMYRHQLARHFKADENTIKRWERLTGVYAKRNTTNAPRVQRRQTASPTAPKPSRPHGGTPWTRAEMPVLDDSAAGRAQRELQRLVGPCFKVATRNPSDRSGDYFVAGKRMTAADMIELAQRKAA